MTMLVPYSENSVARIPYVTASPETFTAEMYQSPGPSGTGLEESNSTISSSFGPGLALM